MGKSISISDREWLLGVIESRDFDIKNLAALLASNDEVVNQTIRGVAASETERLLGNNVYLRGLIEFSNHCTKNCFYCGIRKGNKLTGRYMMTEDEILESAIWSDQNGYGSVVLQSGESEEPEFIEFISGVLKKIKKQTSLGITLCVGEQTKEVYRRFFDSGAHRYLLRIETSDRDLYQKLHPPNHSFDRRLECLDHLRDVGYQVGTGVMIGLPGQTEEHLAGDILFFRDRDFDMIGMGPYITHPATPLALKEPLETWQKRSEHIFQLSLKMISLVRLVCGDINIASTTAFQAIHPEGRELGFVAGANIVMPNITPVKYRDKYILYSNKPCIRDSASDCSECITARIGSTGKIIKRNEWGDSPHFLKKAQSRKQDKK